MTQARDPKQHPAKGAATGVEHVVVAPDELLALIREVGERCGLPAEHVDLFAHGLLEADLRGLPSHGVYRLDIYARGFLSGNINPNPTLRESGDSPGFRLIDADNGLGVIVGQLAMDRAVELARDCGVGAVSVRNSNHSGVLAIHVIRAARAGMIGYFTSNAPALMSAWGGQEAILSNSPFAYAFPTSGEAVVVDMACSAAARGRIRFAASDGSSIPLGWALDANGRETTDALAAMDGLILPMANNKGSGLAVANEILSACLSGSRLSKDVPRDFLRTGADTLDSWDIGHFALALDIGAVRPPDAFIADVDELSDAIHSLSPRDGFDRVRLPGEPENESATRLAADGIPLSEATVRSIERLRSELGLDSSLTVLAGHADAEEEG
jgi:LDH2 family malate/lactate/ureidoglycolate dehydrogenase